MLIWSPVHLHTRVARMQGIQPFDVYSFTVAGSIAIQFRSDWCWFSLLMISVQVEESIYHQLDETILYGSDTGTGTL